MDIHVTYGFLMFFVVFILNYSKVLSDDITIVLYWISLGLQIFNI